MCLKIVFIPAIFQIRDICLADSGQSLSFSVQQCFMNRPKTVVKRDINSIEKLVKTVSDYTLHIDPCSRLDSCFYRATCMHSADYAVARCLSVRLSVTRRNSVQTVIHIFKIISPSGSPTILVFPYQTGWQSSDEDPFNGVNGDVECIKNKNNKIRRKTIFNMADGILTPCNVIRGSGMICH